MMNFNLTVRTMTAFVSSYPMMTIMCTTKGRRYVRLFVGLFVRIFVSSGFDLRS